jgi:hypothetical protein
LRGNSAKIHEIVYRKANFCGELANIRKYLLQNKFVALKNAFYAVFSFVLAKIREIKIQICLYFKPILE